MAVAVMMQKKTQALAVQFVEGRVPLTDFWRALDGAAEVGTAVVSVEDVVRGIEEKLASRRTLSELSGWAGTAASFSCFLPGSRQVKAALTRLAMSELSDEGLRALSARLTLESRQSARRAV